MQKQLFELILSVAMVGAWALVAATASEATQVDAPASGAVKVAEAASAATS